MPTKIELIGCSIDPTPGAQQIIDFHWDPWRNHFHRRNVQPLLRRLDSFPCRPNKEKQTFQQDHPLEIMLQSPRESRIAHKWPKNARRIVSNIRISHKAVSERESTVPRILKAAESKTVPNVVVATEKTPYDKKPLSSEMSKHL